MANDINVVGDWTPIQDFRGTLDGAGHTITLSGTVGQRAVGFRPFRSLGLFGEVYTGNVNIRNLSVYGRIDPRSSAFHRNARDFSGGLIGMAIGDAQIRSIAMCFTMLLTPL